jgi:hypothetical protein
VSPWWQGDAELLATVERERGRLDVLVNDIFGGDRCMPDCWGYLAEHGWERDDGEGVDKFR